MTENLLSPRGSAKATEPLEVFMHKSRSVTCTPTCCQVEHYRCDLQPDWSCWHGAGELLGKLDWGFEVGCFVVLVQYPPFDLNFLGLYCWIPGWKFQNFGGGGATRPPQKTN